MSVDQTKADEHYNKPAMDTCSECGMQFLSDDEMLDNNELCHECARHKRDNDECAQDFADAVCHAMGRDFEQDDLRAMYDEGMTVEQACADISSSATDRAYERAMDNRMRMEDFR